MSGSSSTLSSEGRSLRTTQAALHGEDIAYHDQYHERSAIHSLDICGGIRRILTWSQVDADYRCAQLPNFLTVADVLRSLYSMQCHFRNAIFTGLGYMGMNHFIVH